MEEATHSVLTSDHPKHKRNYIIPTCQIMVSIVPKFIKEVLEGLVSINNCGFRLSKTKQCLLKCGFPHHVEYFRIEIG